MRITGYRFVILVLLTTLSLRSYAELSERTVDLYSEGIRVRGTVLHPPAQNGQKFPAVILSHGWGGTAALLRTQAQQIAGAGYFVLVVDYRGWGESEGRWVRDDAGTSPRRELREVVDPIDQATDLFNAVHWLMGEPMVDTAHIGLWGTSFSGGLVVHVAARDPRIKAIVSQVAWFGQPRSSLSPEVLKRSESDATRRARGEIGYPPPSAREVGNLRGAPVRESFLRYAPILDVAHLVDCAVLIIDAEHEELFNLEDHGAQAFRVAPEPKRRVVIPGISHYGVYGQSLDASVALAIEWFDQYLKPVGRNNRP